MGRKMINSLPPASKRKVRIKSVGRHGEFLGCIAHVPPCLSDLVVKKVIGPDVISAGQNPRPVSP